MTRDEFVARYGAVYEASPWVAERAWDGGASEADDLAARFAAVVDRAGRHAQLALLRAHPDLAGRVKAADLAPASAEEQRGAGLDQCGPDEAAEFLALNEAYTARFGFPFILAVRGKDRADILDTFRTRVENDPKAEFATALAEVHKIAALRLAAPRAPVESDTATLADLRALAEAALARAGADAASVTAIADTVMAAEAGGSRSHGLFRVPGYCHALSSGLVNGAPQVRMLEGPDAVVRLDGGGGFAPVAYAQGLPALAERATRLGTAALALSNVYHLSAMWHEVEFLAARGLAAFACTANFAYLAPHGGTRPFFGTNPIAFAYPGDPPVAFDFATSAMARGDIILAGREGRSVPPGMGVGPDGAPTTDPAAILKGAQLPFGGHKGSALALMVELLCGGVVGDGFSDEVSPDASGAPPGGIFILALSPDGIGGPGARAAADAFVARLAAEPGVRVPGARRHALPHRDTAEVPVELMTELRALAGA